MNFGKKEGQSSSIIRKVIQNNEKKSEKCCSKHKPVNTFCNAPPVKRTINCSLEEVHEPENARLEKHLFGFRE